MAGETKPRQLTSQEWRALRYGALIIGSVVGAVAVYGLAVGDRPANGSRNSSTTNIHDALLTVTCPNQDTLAVCPRKALLTVTCPSEQVVSKVVSAHIPSFVMRVVSGEDITNTFLVLTKGQGDVIIEGSDGGRIQQIDREAITHGMPFEVLLPEGGVFELKNKQLDDITVSLGC